MARLRFNGSAPIQLPTPFGYIVKPGDVVEVPDHLVHHLRQTNISDAFTVSPQGSFHMPPASAWEDVSAAAPEPTSAPPTPEAGAEGQRGLDGEISTDRPADPAIPATELSGEAPATAAASKRAATRAEATAGAPEPETPSQPTDPGA